MSAGLQPLLDEWKRQWPEALGIWSKFTRLRSPLWCLSDAQARGEGLSSSFAMIRFSDHAIVINLDMIERLGLSGFGREILAHEIGHHVYCPSNLNEDARMIARMRWALPTREEQAGMISNLYSDLLINDYLQRSAQWNVAGVYREIVQKTGNRLWTMYMRIYEILWGIQRGKLAPGRVDDRLEGDAQLGARLVRSYARDWLDGSGRFAALCLPYLLEDDPQQTQKLLASLRDMVNSAAGGMPEGLASIEEGEKEGAIHPSLDPDLAGLDEAGLRDAGSPPKAPSSQGASQGQFREPFEYGDILRSMGLRLTDHEISVRYYRERAIGNLVRFPSRTSPVSTDPLPEGLESWDIGSALEDLDWFESVASSPHVIPGVTTVQRVWGTSAGANPQRQPLDLDLYIDSSGSMPNPQRFISYLTLAGTIIALSALRAGARVQATLWSGTRQFYSTEGFVSNEEEILRILTDFIGGATAFPIHKLRDTYQGRTAYDRPVTILIISDNGVTTMYARDEKGNDGYEIARMALEKARGGGTMALNLYGPAERDKDLVRARDQGWQIFPVSSWEQLVDFARGFSRMKYGEAGDP